MGLDQYLRAKTNSIKHKSSRGACGGLFPIAPADNGTTEIGYWRKAYAVSDYLRQVLEIYDEFYLEDKEVPYNKVLEIIDYAKEQIDGKAFEDESFAFYLRRGRHKSGHSVAIIPPCIKALAYLIFLVFHLIPQCHNHQNRIFDFGV